MNQLKGEFECKLDPKGRLKLPAALLRQLESENDFSFTVNRGFEKNLMLYPKNIWEEKTREINQRLNNYNKKHRQFIRYFYRGATEVIPDGADRILLPKSLMEHAGLDKEIILFAYQHQIEIWSKDQYLNALNNEPEDFSDLADEVFGSD
ncbi:MAG TPA: division/cell wall cluster transcriptional repressor MraZ [Saprospiraceae bacterium]|nr:division/cell wall cluster transcriptional repressor MraZ [Saprospiraceae bacterium]